MKKNTLNPLFDKDLNHAGWIDSNSQIFDAGMNWVAFVVNDHAWSASTIHWLGPVKNMSCMDALGKPVAWNPKAGVSTIHPPVRPPRATPVEPPPRPRKRAVPASPARPAAPSRGWSILSFEQWLLQ